MRLVFIYGAPAVGKLTTARALAGITGFRVFHNHVAFDLAKSVFDFPSLPFVELMTAVRLATFEAAAAARLPGLIFTFVYVPPDDDPFVAKTVEIVGRHGGDVAFVRLLCDPATNERRVLGEDRRAIGKITTVEALHRTRERWDTSHRVRGAESLEIDNSALAADEVARRIVVHFALPARRA